MKKYLKILIIATVILLGSKFQIALASAPNPTICKAADTNDGYSYFAHSTSAAYDNNGLLNVSVATTGNYQDGRPFSLDIFGWDANCVRHLAGNDGFGYTATYFGSSQTPPVTYTFVLLSNTTFKLTSGGSDISPVVTTSTLTDISTFPNGISVDFRTDEGFGFANTESPSFLGSGSNIDFAITDPLNTSTISASDSYTIKGTCVNNGTNILAFRRDILDQFESSVFNIDCVNHSFSYVHKIDGFLTKFYIVDKTDGSFVLTSYTVTNDRNVTVFTPNKMALIYPPTDGQNHYTVQPANLFPFRFSYSFTKSSDYNTARFKMFTCTNITFTNCPTQGADFFVKLQDPKPNGNFDVLVNIQANTTYYFKAEIDQSDTNPLWSISMDFVVLGDPNSTVLPDAGSSGGNCSNFLCDLFIPSHDFWTNFIPATSDILKTKVPFAYFYALTGAYSSDLPTGAQNQDIANFTVGIHTSTVNFSQKMDFFNFTDPNLQNAYAPFRAAMSAILWAGFGWFLLTRAFRIFKA